MEGCPPNCEGLKRGKGADAGAGSTKLGDPASGGNLGAESAASTPEGCCTAVPGSKTLAKNFGSTGSCVLDFLVLAIALTFLMAVFKKVFSYIRSLGRRRSETCSCSFCMDL